MALTHPARGRDALATWKLAKEYVETESGKRSDRPQLAAALKHAKAIGATLVFAKLDRLTRNVDLLRSLVATDVDLVFCDLPHVPAGGMGRFLLTRWPPWPNWKPA